MKQNKEIYSQPTCELLVIRFEQNIMSYTPTFSSTYGTEEMSDGGEEDF